MKGEYISIETLKMYQEIEKENKELNERINKAIEYLRKIEMFEKKFGFDDVRRKKLLNILNGDSNE